MERKNEKYIEWIRDQDCAICLQYGPSEAHHFKGEFHLSGAGLKAPDVFSIPLCSGCHRSIHNAEPGWKDRQRVALIRTIIDAFSSGIVQVSGSKTAGDIQ